MLERRPFALECRSLAFDFLAHLSQRRPLGFQLLPASGGLGIQLCLRGTSRIERVRLSAQLFLALPQLFRDTLLFLRLGLELLLPFFERLAFGLGGPKVLVVLVLRGGQRGAIALELSTQRGQLDSFGIDPSAGIGQGVPISIKRRSVMGGCLIVLTDPLSFRRQASRARVERRLPQSALVLP